MHKMSKEKINSYGLDGWVMKNSLYDIPYMPRSHDAVMTMLSERAWATGNAATTIVDNPDGTFNVIGYGFTGGGYEGGPRLWLIYHQYRKEADARIPEQEAVAR